MQIAPDYYREKAVRTMHLAHRATDPDAKSYLLRVANEYEKLTAEAEQSWCYTPIEEMLSPEY